MKRPAPLASSLALLLAFAPCFSLRGEDAAKGLVLVTNKGDHTLSIVDSATNKQLAAVLEEGVTGHEVAASADGKFAYVPIFGSGGVGSPGTDGQLIRVIDLAQQKIVHTIDLGKGLRPHCPVFNAKRNLLFVTTENEDSITIIDAATNKIIGAAPTGQEQSHMLAVNKDGTRGYTANVGPGTVSVIDLEKKEVIKVIKVGRMVQRISLSVDEKRAFTSDQFDQTLAVIDTETNEVTKRIPLPGTGYGSAPTPDGKSLVIALIDLHRVGIIDLESMELKHSIPVPKAPQYVLMRPDGKTAYVSCDASAQIAAIDLEKREVSALIDVGKTADGMAWAPLK